MTYSPNIPQDLPPPNVAVNSIRTNFAQFASVFSNTVLGVVYNHLPINNVQQGKHGAVIFQSQTNDPGVTNDYDAVYSKSVTSTASISEELFLQVPQFLPNNTPNFPQQLTYNTVNTAGPQFQTFLPGGYVMIFGMVSAVPAVITPVPAISGIVSVVVNPNNFTTAGTPIPFDAYAVVDPSSTFFTINSSLATGVYTFTWIAICRQ